MKLKNILKTYKSDTNCTSNLLRTLEYAYQNSRFYGTEQYKTVLENKLEGFEDLPFTTKKDLSQFNDDFLCTSIDEVKEYVTTSGTIGEPVTFFLTEKDLRRLEENEKQSMITAGCSENDVFQLMTTVDKRFMAGLAYILGVRKLGAGMVRVGPGTPFLQWDSIQRFKPTVLIAIPSFIHTLIEYAKQNEIDYKNSSVKKIICIGEPIRQDDFSLNQIGNKIISDWEVELISTYASTEMGAAFTECSSHNGGHLQEDLIYLEVVDETGKLVKSGESGEVVVTTLDVEGMPLIRFKTGDICTVHFEKCSCGNSSTRLGPVLGRKEQMIKSKGTTIFPQSIINVDLEQDLVSILLNDKLEAQKQILKKLDEKLSSVLRFKPNLVFLREEEIKQIKFQENKRKPTIFMDLR
jgi:phenylacetate-CoA ligase